MFENIYPLLDEAQVRGYFDRIGMIYNSGRRKDKAYLDEIVRAQLRAVPFDDADVWAKGLCPSLDKDDLYEKIIAHRRGGYCFELNSLFCFFLNSIGFDSCIVIVHLGHPGMPLGMPSHCAVLVETEDGRRFADVGFGGPVPDGSVPMDGSHDNGYYMKKDGFHTIVGFDDEEGNFFSRFTFKEMPCWPVELEPLNFNVSQRPGSGFRDNLMMNLRMDNGFAEIGRQIFKYKCGEEIIERPIVSEEDARLIAEKYFGLEPGGLPTRAF